MMIINETQEIVIRREDKVVELFRETEENKKDWQ